MIKNATSFVNMAGDDDGEVQESEVKEMLETDYMYLMKDANAAMEEY